MSSMRMQCRPVDLADDVARLDLVGRARAAASCARARGRCRAAGCSARRPSPGPRRARRRRGRRRPARAGSSSSTGAAVRWSNGTSKKPWICPECRSTRHHPVGAGGRQHVGDQLGGDRLAAGRLAVLARVAVVGADRGDLLGRRALGRVDHDELLHHRVVDRPAVRLEDEDVRAADRARRSGSGSRRWRTRAGSPRRARRRGGWRSRRRARDGTGRRPARGGAWGRDHAPRSRPTLARRVPPSTARRRQSARLEPSEHALRTPRTGHDGAGGTIAPASEQANGPTSASGADRARRCTSLCRAARRAPTTVSISVQSGPISAPSPIAAVPSQDDAGQQRRRPRPAGRRRRRRSRRGPTS